MIEQNLKETCKVVQYADDKVLFCDDNDIKNALQLLQKFCQNLSLYFTKNSLKLNTKKTQLIILSNKHQGRNHIPKFNIILDDNKNRRKARN